MWWLMVIKRECYHGLNWGTILIFNWRRIFENDIELEFICHVSVTAKMEALQQLQWVMALVTECTAHTVAGLVLQWVMALVTECTAHTVASCGFAFSNSLNKFHHYVSAFWAVSMSTHKIMKQLHMIENKYQQFLIMLRTAIYSFKPFVL